MVDEQNKVDENSPYASAKPKKKSVFDLAQDNLNSEVNDGASSMLNKANKSLVKSMMFGGLSF